MGRYIYIYILYIYSRQFCRFDAATPWGPISMDLRRPARLYRSTDITGEHSAVIRIREYVGLGSIMGSDYYGMVWHP